MASIVGDELLRPIQEMSGFKGRHIDSFYPRLTSFQATVAFISFPVSLWQTRSADLEEERYVLHLPVQCVILSHLHNSHLLTRTLNLDQLKDYNTLATGDNNPLLRRLVAILTSEGDQRKETATPSLSTRKIWWVVCRV